MKFLALASLFTAASAVDVSNMQHHHHDHSNVQYQVVNNMIFADGCPTPLPLTQGELDNQLDLLSKKCEKVNYDNAIMIYGALKG
jgi:hypothetical protein